MGSIILEMFHSTMELSREHVLVVSSQKKKFIKKTKRFSNFKSYTIKKTHVRKISINKSRIDDITFNNPDGNFKDIDVSIDSLLLDTNISFIEFAARPSPENKFTSSIEGK